MVRKTAVGFGLLVGLSAGLIAQVPGASSQPRLAAGLQVGYNSGLGVEVHGLVADFAEGFPFQVRLGIRRTAVEPGVALDARRIFINNNTNGIPEESGRTWNFRLDFLYPAQVLSLRKAYFFGGVRHASFTGNFNFVGGNEDFDISSNHWGFGGGLESHFGVGSQVDMVITTGVEYFASSTLSGHDTAYSPDGDSVNPREDYTYADADAAIGQPKFAPLIMFGFLYHF
ncbi:MAG: hypothetical protein AMS18_01920 [Gemmatimonas sp. SG8_17]|nr:MAG: hypothetical protein AMS18_01920 [Gemmatimonas sp. SG8_17]